MAAPTAAATGQVVSQIIELTKEVNQVANTKNISIIEGPVSKIETILRGLDLNNLYSVRDDFETQIKKIVEVPEKITNCIKQLFLSIIVEKLMAKEQQLKSELAQQQQK